MGKSKTYVNVNTKIVNAKYAIKHHETYGDSSATNEKQVRSELAV